MNPDNTQQFLLAAPAAELIDGFSRRFKLIEEPPRELEYCFYDSFDWRLYHAGLAAAEVIDGERRGLYLLRFHKKSLGH